MKSKIINYKYATLVALAVLGSFARADTVNWDNIGGMDFVTPVKNQGSAGTCWAHGATATLESKYMLTRNDPLFQPDCSEQQLVCANVGSVDGGNTAPAFDYYLIHGVVAESELPYRASSTSPDWPLDDGWHDRAWRITSGATFLGSNPTWIKQGLKLYGPLAMEAMGSTAWYSPPTGSISSHVMLITGFCDDVAAPGGGYWIVKNSWGDWNGDGYCKISYAAFNIPGVNRAVAISGAAYYTGAMGTATWQGGTNLWAAGDGSNWANWGFNPYPASGSVPVWQNTELAAQFNANANNQIILGGAVIAHGLTFNPGAIGYRFSGGSLTVTGGGIVANESVTINAPVTVGAPQTWTTAAGKTLQIDSDVHTVISTLTIGGDGNTYINGNIDGGGVINSVGAAAGDLVKNGSGTLTLAGADTRARSTTINAGMFVLAPSGSTRMDINNPGFFAEFTQFLGYGSLHLDGSLVLDVADVTASSGSWDLIDDYLATNFGETFAVELLGGNAFVEGIDGAYTCTDTMNHLWTFTEASGLLTMVTVPEPGTLLLLAVGSTGIYVCVGRRRMRPCRCSVNANPLGRRQQG